MPELSEWGSFYVIVGSAGGALIGLQFVVMTLIADRPSLSQPEMGAAFATPSVVHFAVVLLLSAILSAPWRGMGSVSIIWAVIGVSGLVYTVIVIRRLKKQTIYRPVFEDWLFHALLPATAYVMLTGSGVVAHSYSRRALFFVGFATLLLLFVGIHNAWDAVTYHVFFSRRGQGS